MNQLRGIVLVLVSATAFGAMAIFAQGAYGSGVGILTLLFLRFGVATIALQGITRWSGFALPQGRNLKILIAIGSIAFVGQALCFFGALTLIPAGLVGLLLYLYPTLVVVFNLLLGQESVTRPKLLALASATLGIVLMAGLTPGANPLGVALGLGAAVIYAIYVMVGSHVLRQEAAIPACTVMVSSAAVVFGVLVAIQGPQWPTTGLGWGAALAIGLVSTTLSIVTLLLGIQAIGPVSASTLSTFEPVVTLVLAAVFLQEPIGLFQGLGGVLVLAAVIILAHCYPGTN